MTAQEHREMEPRVSKSYYYRRKEQIWKGKSESQPDLKSAHLSESPQT